MPNILDGFAVIIGAAASKIKELTSKKAKKYKCKWKDCKGEHDKDINPIYPDKGSVEKGKATSGKDYEKEWVKEDLEPWKFRGIGYNPNRKEKHYHDDVLSMDSKYNRDIVKKAVSDYPFPTYKTQKHHVISVHLFSDFSVLAYNAKLVDYNVNDKENGICLPSFIADIVRHDLQCHFGSHPAKYDSMLKPMLSKLQKASKKYCSKNRQFNLKIELELISSRAITNIENWKNGWYVRSTALEDRKKSYKKANIPMPN
ncbi:MAG: AHH domain-containing protein [Deltaproteobacteria bacterium]|nr:AHH domain-containing protein [Deltaproteobacteria bacterium]